MASIFMATMAWHILLLFFLQAEDGIRVLTVTGVQTCALPISCSRAFKTKSCAKTIASDNLYHLSRCPIKNPSWRPSLRKNKPGDARLKSCTLPARDNLRKEIFMALHIDVKERTDHIYFVELKGSIDNET